MSRPTQGWWLSPFANGNSKWHYYDSDGNSLCRKYVKLGGQFPTDATVKRFDKHPENCAACQRKLAKIREGERHART